MSDYHKLLTVKNIPQCTSKMTQFNADLWEGMTSRISQMIISNSSEHKINWNVKPDRGTFGAQRPLISIGSMLFLRGDGVYEYKEDVKGVYTSQTSLCRATGLRTYKDSQRLFGHEKNVCILTNN